jgi:hypothetical protein
MAGAERLRSRCDVGHVIASKLEQMGLWRPAS